MGDFKLNLLNDIVDFFERIESRMALTEEQIGEIVQTVDTAIEKTEEVFGQKNGDRNIEHNPEVGKAWNNAGTTIRKYLPQNKFARSLQMKGEAWVNIHKWSADDLEKENITIEGIKDRLEKFASIRRKYFRPEKE